MVKKALYLPLEINTQTFNRIIRFLTRNVGVNSDLQFTCSKEIAEKLQKKINEPNEFIRLKHGEYYMDVAMGEIKIKTTYSTCSKEIAQKLQKKLKEPNNFTRLKQGNLYTDITIEKIKVTEHYSATITFGKLIDNNRTHFIPKPKNK